MHQHPFPVLDDEDEVVAGPCFKDVRRGGRVRYLNTPLGRFDAAAVLRAAGDWRPDLILVHVDSTRGCMPSGLQALKIPTVLLVGDTHHLNAPLRTLLSYAAEERFDHVVVWNRQHAHFFHEAGARNLHWLPGLLFWVPDFPRCEERKAQVGFFGSLGRYHPRRTLLLTRLSAAGIPLDAGPRSRGEGLRMLSGSAIGLNQSLNGEFNLRVLETFEAGALLLTDRLRPQTGLDSLFMPGRDYLEYGSTDEAVERAQWALAHRVEAEAIARSGQVRAQELFSREARSRQLIEILTFGDHSGPFSLENESRCQRAVTRPQDVIAFQERLIAYEFIQELHRLQGSITVVGDRAACPELAGDLADLSRLEWVAPSGIPASATEIQGERIGVGRMDDPALAGCGDHFRYCPQSTELGLVVGWRRLSPSLALYERLDRPYGEEVFAGGWRLCWPGARRAIVTLAIGDRFRESFEQHFLPSWRRYVERHRLDLVVLHAPVDNSQRAANRSPAWQKCLVGIHPAVAHYEQVAWVDADIVITDHAPDIFAGVAPGEVGAVDLRAIDIAFPGATARTAAAYAARGISTIPATTSAEIYERWGLPITELGEKAEQVVQTGCFVFSPRLHGPVLTEVYRNYEDKGSASWNYEMWPLSFELVKKTRIRWLDWRFNACTSDLFLVLNDRYWELPARFKVAPLEQRAQRLKEVHALIDAALEKAYFLHLAGMSNYAELLPPSVR
jgi:hypothetical protein